MLYNYINNYIYSYLFAMLLWNFRIHDEEDILEKYTFTDFIDIWGQKALG